jgi:hypothetical protein
VVLHALGYLQKFSEVRLPCVGIEPGTAEQQSGALSTKPPRTLISHAAPSKPRRTLSMNQIFVFKYKYVKFFSVYTMKGIVYDLRYFALAAYGKLNTLALSFTVRHKIILPNSLNVALL